MKIINRIKRALICLFCSFGFLFFTAGFQPQESKPPLFVGSMAEPFQATGVFVVAKAYTGMESYRYLGKDFISKGLQPLQITLQNNTGKTYVLSNDKVQLPLVATDAVAMGVTKESIPRSIAWKVASFFFWPFLIPSTIDTILTVKKHMHMQKDYFAKTIKEQEAILPYSTVHRIVFIPGITQKQFLLHLKEEKSGAFHLFRVKINR